MSSLINAVGVLFYAQSTDRYLYLMRNDSKHPNCWGLPGGKCEANETLLAAISRECVEEMGQMPEFLKLLPIEKFTSADGNFGYHTFFCLVADEFVPRLNDEHCGYAWVSSGTYPRPMHPGLWTTVQLDSVREKIDIIRANKKD